MKRALVAAIALGILAASAAQAEPPVFKDKQYFGPIPYNGLAIGVGFLDGCDFSYLFDHLSEYAAARNGYETWEDLSIAPYGHLRYDRQVTPNHFLRLSSSLAYITSSSDAALVATVDTNNYYLEGGRTFTTYLLTFEVGFVYCFIRPEPQRFSPYVGGGFAAVVPMNELESNFTHEGEPFSTPSENVSETNLQAGLHLEFGMNYYISSKYAVGIEGKYQMAQSKFDIHGGNFDLDYSGFMLTLNIIYYL